MEKIKELVRATMDRCYKVTGDGRRTAPISYGRCVIYYDSEAYEKINAKTRKKGYGTIINYLPFKEEVARFTKKLKQYCTKYNCMDIYEDYANGIMDILQEQNSRN